MIEIKVKKISLDASLGEKIKCYQIEFFHKNTNTYKNIRKKILWTGATLVTTLLNSNFVRTIGKWHWLGLATDSYVLNI